MLGYIADVKNEDKPATVENDPEENDPEEDDTVENDPEEGPSRADTMNGNLYIFFNFAFRFFSVVRRFFIYSISRCAF